MSLRRIQVSDLPQVRALHESLFSVSYDDSFYNSLLEPLMYSLVMVEDDEKIIAVATAWVSYSSFGFCGAHTVRCGYLATFGVDENFRKRGLGSTLLRTVDNYLRRQARCDLIKLHVDTANSGAIAFYATKQFKTVKYCKNYYLTLNRDAYKMVKPFTEKGRLFLQYKNSTLSKFLVEFLLLLQYI